MAQHVAESQGTPAPFDNLLEGGPLFDRPRLIISSANSSDGTLGGGVVPIALRSGEKDHAHSPGERRGTVNGHPNDEDAGTRAAEMPAPPSKMPAQLYPIKGAAPKTNSPPRVVSPEGHRRISVTPGLVQESGIGQVGLEAADSLPKAREDGKSLSAATQSPGATLRRQTGKDSMRAPKHKTLPVAPHEVPQRSPQAPPRASASKSFPHPGTREEELQQQGRQIENLSAILAFIVADDEEGTSQHLQFRASVRSSPSVEGLLLDQIFRGVQQLKRREAAADRLLSVTLRHLPQADATQQPTAAHLSPTPSATATDQPVQRPGEAIRVQLPQYLRVLHQKEVLEARVAELENELAEALRGEEQREQALGEAQVAQADLRALVDALRQAAANPDSAHDSAFNSARGNYQTERDLPKDTPSLNVSAPGSLDDRGEDAEVAHQDPWLHSAGEVHGSLDPTDADFTDFHRNSQSAARARIDSNPRLEGAPHGAVAEEQEPRAALSHSFSTS